MAASASLPSRNVSTSAFSSTIGPLEVLTNRADRFIERELRPAYQPPGPRTEDEMDRENICPFKQFFLGNQSGASGGSLFWRKVLAPGDDFHSKRVGNPRNFAPDIAETEYP